MRSYEITRDHMTSCERSCDSSIPLGKWVHEEVYSGPSLPWSGERPETQLSFTSSTWRSQSLQGRYWTYTYILWMSVGQLTSNWGGVSELLLNSMVILWWYVYIYVVYMYMSSVCSCGKMHYYIVHMCSWFPHFSCIPLVCMHKHRESENPQCITTM